MMARIGRVIGLLAFGIGVGVVIAYWLKQQEEIFQQQVRQQRPTPPSKPAPPQETQIILSKKTLDQAAAGDDLTRINGVGPKIAEALRANGITSFVGLAGISSQELYEKLKGVRGLTEEKVSDWIQQAAGLNA